MAEEKASLMEEIKSLVAAHLESTLRMTEEVSQYKEQVLNKIEENEMLKLARDCMVEQCRDLALLLEESKEKALEVQMKLEQEKQIPNSILTPLFN